MNFFTLLTGLILFFSFQSSANDCDRITVTLVSSDNFGCPQFIDWTVKDDLHKYDLEGGEALLIGDDSTFILQSFPEEFSYRIYFVADSSFMEKQFELIVTKNGVLLPLVYSGNPVGHELHFASDEAGWHQKQLASGFIEEATSTLASSVQMVQLQLERFRPGTYVDVVASDGTVVHSREVFNSNVNLDCTSWPEGNYMVVCRFKNYNSVVASVKRTKS